MQVWIGGLFNLSLSPSLLVYVTREPVITPTSNGSGQFTMLLATYTSLVGRFSSIKVVLVYSRLRQSTLACYAVSKAESTYGSSTLSVTVAVDPCEGTRVTTTTDAGLSTGAIVGIAVGAAVAGILIAVLIAVLVSRCFSFFIAFELTRML